MTAPDASVPTTSPWPEEEQGHLPPAGISPVDGSRAALTLLIVQNVVAALCMGMDVLNRRTGLYVHYGLNLSLGASLLVAFAVVVLVAFTAFRPAMRALLADTRWRTPPSWGVALAAFVLGFLASRAFALAFVSFFPETSSTIPQFLSKGPDLAVLLLAAGLLVPLAEEVAFRGLMMRGQERAAGFGLAAIASTFAFALAHGVPASVAGILPLAYVLARVVQHSGSLWNSVIIHALNNSISVGLGSVLLSKGLGNTDQATQLLKNEALRLPLAFAALLFGVAVLAVLHLWLTPKPDPQEHAEPAVWVTASYVLIVLFGLSAMLVTLPAIQNLPDTLRNMVP